MQTVSMLLVQPWVPPSYSESTATTLVRCTIWHHTCLSMRFLPNPCAATHHRAPNHEEFGTAILDTFENGTQAEAVNRILASRNSCRTGQATHRICVVRTVHLFHMEPRPTRTDCRLAFCSFCSCVVVMLERSSGTLGTQSVFETETRNRRVFSVLVSSRWRDWRGSPFSTSSLGGRSMCSGPDHLGVPTDHCHKFVLTVQLPFRRTCSNSSIAEVLCTSANDSKLATKKKFKEPSLASTHDTI